MILRSAAIASQPGDDELQSALQAAQDTQEKFFTNLPSRQTRALSSSSVHVTSRLVNAVTSSCKSTAFARSTSDDFSLVTFPSLASVGASPVGSATADGDFSSLCDISLVDKYWRLQTWSKGNRKGRRTSVTESVGRGWGERRKLAFVGLFLNVQPAQSEIGRMKGPVSTG